MPSSIYLKNWHIPLEMFEFDDSEHSTIYAKNFSISCTEPNHYNYGSFLPKFGCRGNTPCSLENSDRLFEFADLENSTIHAKKS